MPARAITMVILGVAVGLAAGIGGYTFIYARGASYLTEDPCRVDRHGTQGAAVPSP
ncbi:MAG: hypothetical protein HY698_08050 [Deltaproteobacteria bacterium]|nr:hypothetical protein [Deltaproteobacteria bacterium]